MISPPKPPVPPNEDNRLAALHALGVLDTDVERRFDRITRTAARLFEVPIAVVSLVDADRQWFKSCVGLEAKETPRSVAFCAHTIVTAAPMVVPDAALDERFAQNPLVTGPPHIRFYAGHPLIDRDGHALGTLCVIDRKPRGFDHEQQAALADLAEMVVLELTQGPRTDQGGSREPEGFAQREFVTELWLQAWRARRQALEDLRLRDELMLAVNHELRTPLAGILGAAEILAESLGRQNTPTAPFARMVLEQASTMQRLLEGLLTYQQLAAGKLELRRERLNLVEIARQAATAAQSSAADSGILITCTAATEEAIVLGDGPQLQEALGHLLTNAVKFSRGGKDVSVHVAAGETGVEVAVKDLGIGVHEADHNRMFEPFVQLSGGATRQHGGLGLGLATVRHLIHQLGGTVAMTSSLGLGSTFSIILARAPSEESK